MKLPLFQIDAFSEGPFTGNPAAVVPLAEPMDEALMQKIAEENQLSETAFTVPIPAHAGAQDAPPGFALRWFTPTTEVELCGHATLAAARALREGGFLAHDTEQVDFSTKSGPLRASFLKNERIEIDLPAAVSTKPIPPDLSALAERALNVPIQSAFDHRYILAVLDAEATVRSLAPDLGALLKAGKPIIATAPGDDPQIDFVSRFFAPTLGVPEDPVTGSAHCQLVPYWAATLQRPSLTARQLSPRSGLLHCRLDSTRVHLSGATHLYLTGSIETNRQCRGRNA